MLVAAFSLALRVVLAVDKELLPQSTRRLTEEGFFVIAIHYGSRYELIGLGEDAVSPPLPHRELEL